jgi:hypothetical protein
MVQTRSGRRVEAPSNDTLGNRRQTTVAGSTFSAPLKWERLPLIVQEAVLEQLAEDYDRHSLEDRRSRAAYATVNLQWQEFFEKLNFNKLILRDSALKDFRKIVKRRLYTWKSGNAGRQRQRTSPSRSRMPRIRHIWLCIELLPYDCKKCKLSEDAKQMAK